MNKKPKICLIYTGGTIGMTRKNGILQPPDNPEDFLNMAPELKEVVEFKPEFPMNKDSTNMIPDDWVKIAKLIYKRKDDGYAGFVIAHGTDTMHFTASALALAFGPNLNFPIVLTGAQTDPSVYHGDARVNLLRACKVALEPIAEVCIAFGEYVFRGCRAQKKDERKFDAFESPAFPQIAYITKTIDIQPLARKKSKSRQKESINFRPHFSKGILQVSLVPGLEPSLLLEAASHKKCKGVILQSFGAGNVPNEFADRYSFEGFIREIVARKKPVILTSQFPGGTTTDSRYATHETAVKVGAIPTGNMTTSCAVVKFRWVLSRVAKEIKEGRIQKSDRLLRIGAWMKRRYVGELGELSTIFTDPDDIDTP